MVEIQGQERRGQAAAIPHNVPGEGPMAKDDRRAREPAQLADKETGPGQESQQQAQPGVGGAEAGVEHGGKEGQR